MNFLKATCTACGLAALLLASSADARPTVYPTGTTIFNPEKAQSDVFVMVVHPNRVTIIDRNGNEYHTWKVPANWSNIRARLDKNGNLLIAGAVKEVGNTTTEGYPAYIAEFSWDGKENWRHSVPKGLDWHNDVTKLKNGNIVYTAYSVIPEEYQKKIKDVELPWGTFKRSGVNMRGDVLRSKSIPKRIKLSGVGIHGNTST